MPASSTPIAFARRLRLQMTEAERLLWRHLRNRQLFGQKIRRQHVIGRYIVDFVHLPSRTVIEADGGQHHESVYDQQRDAWLQREGYLVLRFWNNDILSNPDGVLMRIAEVVMARSPSPQPLSQEGEGPAVPVERGVR